jgi:hypothetical protein
MVLFLCECHASITLLLNSVLAKMHVIARTCVSTAIHTTVTAVQCLNERQTKYKWYESASYSVCAFVGGDCSRSGMNEVHLKSVKHFYSTYYTSLNSNTCFCIRYRDVIASK